MADDKHLLLNENPVHLIYLKKNLGATAPVILKRLNSPFPSDDLVAQLKNEFVATKNLDIPGLRKVISFKEGDGNYELELEYIEGQNLLDLALAASEGMLTFLQIVSGVCNILGQLHQSGWIHGSLNSSNIIINPVTKAPTIIDASLMTRFSLKASSSISAEKLRSILPYISPEQTGRTNRSLDHRSDLYSLGVTFYEILVGKRPFESDDPLELIYAHLARIPAEPHKLNYDIPEILSRIIMKLLAKNAEDRYQSAYGLKFDIDRIIDQWENRQTLRFTIGEKDYTGKLQIPQKLYGRIEAVNTLLDNLNETLAGESRAVFISGDSGTGKSAVVQEVRKPITENKGFFLQGKFDQFARNIPYTAWIQIFKDFVDQLLTSDEAEIQKWRGILMDTMGQSIGVLADLIPNLKLIIHHITPVDELGITETQNRLNDLLNRFFKSIATIEHPVTVFLDDLQWADNASLNLLKTLITDADSKYLFIICAYRHEELMASDPMALKLEEIERAGITSSEIKLGNLSFEIINELLSDTLNAETNAISELTQAVMSKTQGNPYFTYQFINAIYEEGLLKFNWDQSIEKKKQVWDWDLPGIQTRFISNNVVELLVGKIVELPKPVIETLKNAACIGNSFKLKYLATVRKSENESITAYLDTAINEGYIFYKNVNQMHWVREGMDVEYQFSHDRVQQAFYSLIPDEEKQQTHYEIGRLLHASLSPEQVNDQIFQLVFHLNFGSENISDYQQRKWLSQLNLKAGKEAKKIIAYDAAYNYVAIANKLTGESVWNEDEEFATKLGQELLDCTYLSNRFEEAEAYFEFLLSKITDNVKKAELHYRKMIQYQHLSKIDNILDTGLQGLALLGLQFSPKSSRFKVFVELVKTYFMMRGKTDEELKNLPAMKDPASRIAMSLIFKTLTFAYDRSEELMGVLGMKLLQLTIQRGNHEASEAGYNTYAGILSIAFNNATTAAKLTRVAIVSADRTGDKAAMSMAHFGKGMTSYSPFSESYQEFKNSFEIAVEGGAHTDAAPSTMYFYFLSFLQGRRLSEVNQIILDNLYFTDQIKTENFHLILLAGLRCVGELKDGPESVTSGIRGKKITAHELEEQILNTQHRSIRIYARIFQMYNHILFERYSDAIKTEKEILQGINVTLGNVLGAYFLYLQGVLYSLLYPSANNEEKKRYKKIVKNTSSRMKKFQVSSPANYSVWQYLLDAGLAKINGNPLDAQKLFDKAIETARSVNNLNDAAFGSYLCSAFNKENGNVKIADYYLNEAVKGFSAWGAEALASAVASKIKHMPGALAGAGSTLNTSVDQESIIRLSQLISGEIDYNKLIKKLMTVFIENAGAEKAVLIMNDDNHWFIEAEQRKNEEVNIIRYPMPNEKDGSGANAIVSVNICQYVIRTRETVIIEDATLDERFSKSAYVKSIAPKSILCLPLMKKNELTGLVYLENNLMAGAFKTERIQLLNYISSQIAVSVDNAKLYSDVRNLNRSYERFVPKEFLEMLGKKSIVGVKLGDQVQMNMTVLFADIRDFTSRSENLSPSENFKFINDYLSRMEPIIRRYHGFIDKYVGDEIMALFPTNADDAVQCGIAMLHELRVYGDQLKKQNLEPIKIGIGINTGSVMLGTVGGEDRMNSTVISDTVNLASRVEKDTKGSGTPFIITKETLNQLKDPSQYAIRKLGQKIYRGKSTPTTAYEVFEGDDPEVVKLKKATINDFELAIALSDKREYYEAYKIFNAILEKNPADKPAMLYVKSISKLINNHSANSDKQNNSAS